MSRRETKFYLKAITITLFLIALFGYGIFEVWNYATGPEIIVSSPKNGSVVSESLISIDGQGKNIQEITFNDRPIMVDEVGNFSEKILLSYGYNVLELKAQDRFGKTTEQELQIVYK
jgi:hypothetical protein